MKLCVFGQTARARELFSTRLQSMRHGEPNSYATSLLEDVCDAEVIFTRQGSIAQAIEGLMETTKASVDAALYGLKSERLARVLRDVEQRGLRFRLIIDGNKYTQSPATRRILAEQGLPFRLAFGRDGARSKMHHKFAIVDKKLVLTGSYNWTAASEERNHENLLILRNPGLVEAYRDEFEALWAASTKLRTPRS